MRFILWMLVVMMSSVTMVSAEASVGTRENPVPWGESATMHDLEIVVVAFNPDADAELQARNEQNKPSDAGNVLILAKIRATYRGPDATRPDVLRYGFVGASNAALPERHCRTTGSSVDDAAMTADLFPGGSSEFELCLQAPAREVASLVFYVSDVNGQRLFFSLKQPGNAGTPVATPH